MAKIHDYTCPCGTTFEFTHVPAEEPAPCPACGRIATEADQVMGGHTLHVIVPMHRTSLKNKAGYVHTHGDRPAEKNSVAITGSGEIK